MDNTLRADALPGQETLMHGWLAAILARLAESPLLQGLVAALSTFILEDPVTIGCGLLVAERKMAFLTAMVGVSMGIAVGDMGLYGIGRLIGPKVVVWGLVTEQRLERGSRWFRKNLLLAMLISRFMPGMRLPTYVAAGVLRAPLASFMTIAVAASLVWTYFLLHLTILFGERVMPLLGRYRWPVMVIAVLLLVLLQRRAANHINGAEKAASQAGQRPGRVVSVFEFWPPWLFYIPVVLHYLWLAVRHRGLLLPTVANPSIYSGGFIGESKVEILGLVGADQRRWVAPYVAVDKPAVTSTTELEQHALAALSEAGLGLPVVGKPDVGQRGAGVRPLRDEDELRAYLEEFPGGQRLVLQQLVEAPALEPGETGGGDLAAAREAGILYWRMPSESAGQIFSVTLKVFPEVVGDGRSTLAELIDADPRASRIRHLYRRRHHDQLERVLAEGERLLLVFSGNHCQGTIFRDGTHLVTPQLEQRIDEISRSLPGFFFGRFDIRFNDLDSLLAGEGFKIVEINGASAEATHIWDAEMSLVDAYATLFEQFSILFRIGAENRRRGHRPLGLLRLVRDLIAYRRVARAYPMTR